MTYQDIIRRVIVHEILCGIAKLGKERCIEGLEGDFIKKIKIIVA